MPSWIYFCNIKNCSTTCYIEDNPFNRKSTLFAKCSGYDQWEAWFQRAWEETLQTLIAPDPFSTSLLQSHHLMQDRPLQEKSGVCRLHWFSSHGWMEVGMEVFQRGTLKRSLQRWLGYLGALTWSSWHGDAMMKGDVMWSLERHGGITGRASRGSAACRPGPDPRGPDPLSCLDFSTTFNSFGLGNVRVLFSPPWDFRFNYNTKLSWVNMKLYNDTRNDGMDAIRWSRFPYLLLL
jgi:hypothetical protein